MNQGGEKMSLVNQGEQLQCVNIECPLCEQKHEIRKMKRVAMMEIKGVEVSFDEVYFVCENFVDGENEFVDAKIMDSNLLNARNAYRTKKNLLTSYEIVDIRKKYGLSQVEMAKLLGWGEATVSRYESKAIQDEAYDNILREINENPYRAYEFLNKNKCKFSTARADEIKEKIMANLYSGGKEFLKRRNLECEYINFCEPSCYNGFQLLDIDKIESMVSRLASYYDKLYKMQLMKMLWYADSLAFKENGKSITGLVYCRENKGATPIGYNSVMELENIIVREEIEGENIKYKIERNDAVDMSCFSDEEINIINIVGEKFKNCNMDDVIKSIQKEKMYVDIQYGDIIQFDNKRGMGL